MAQDSAILHDICTALLPSTASTHSSPPLTPQPSRPTSQARTASPSAPQPPIAESAERRPPDSAQRAQLLQAAIDREMSTSAPSRTASTATPLPTPAPLAQSSPDLTPVPSAASAPNPPGQPSAPQPLTEGPSSHSTRPLADTVRHTASSALLPGAVTDWLKTPLGKSSNFSHNITNYLRGVWSSRRGFRPFTIHRGGWIAIAELLPQLQASQRDIRESRDSRRNPHHDGVDERSLTITVHDILLSNCS